MNLFPSLRLTFDTLIASAILASFAHANDLSVTFRDGSEGNGRLISSLNIQDGNDLAALILIGMAAYATDSDIYLVHMDIVNRSGRTKILSADQFEIAAGGHRYELTQFMTAKGSPVKKGERLKLEPYQRRTVYGIYAAPNWVAERVRSNDANLYIPFL